MRLKNNLVRFVELPKILDNCVLVFAQTPEHIPFKIKRVYFISKAHPKLPRGLHAHKKNKQIIFCISGSVKLILDNGQKKEKVTLNQSNIGVFLDKMIWHQMQDFKDDTILLVLASDKFNPADYIRNYEEFKKRTSKVS